MFSLDGLNAWKGRDQPASRALWIPAYDAPRCAGGVNTLAKKLASGIEIVLESEVVSLKLRNGTFGLEAGEVFTLRSLGDGTFEILESSTRPIPPRPEQVWAGYDLVERTDTLGGRFQPDTTYHCAHGQVHLFNKILDWKPFDYVSLEQNISIGIKLVQTRRVVGTPSGTKIIFHVRQPDHPVTEELKQIMIGAYEQAAAGLLKQLETDFNNHTS